MEWYLWIFWNPTSIQSSWYLKSLKFQSLPSKRLRFHFYFADTNFQTQYIQTTRERKSVSKLFPSMKGEQSVLNNFEGTNKVWNYSEVKKMNQMEIPYILTNKTLFCLYGVKLNGACVSLMKWDNLKRAGFLFKQIGYNTFSISISITTRSYYLLAMWKNGWSFFLRIFFISCKILSNFSFIVFVSKTTKDGAQ